MKSDKLDCTAEAVGEKYGYFVQLAFFPSSFHIVLIINIFAEFLYKQNTESSGTLIPQMSLNDQVDSVKLSPHINAA